MKLIATNALLYWLSLAFGLPHAVSVFVGLTGSLAGALFLRGLFRVHPSSVACRTASYTLLVCAYPFTVLTLAASLNRSYEHFVPELLAVIAAMLVVIYPVAQIAVAITVRHFVRCADGKTPILQ